MTPAGKDPTSGPGPAAGPIVPRWEWRTFGERFGPAQRCLDALELGEPQRSEEVYLLGPGRADNVKIRDGLLDVKHLERVDPAGLEQWRPVQKAPFPLAPDQVLATYRALGLDPPAHRRAAWSQQDLLADLTGPSGSVLAVTVRKARRRFRRGGCVGEVTEVVAGDLATRTVAGEAEVPARVAAEVAALGFSGAPNVNYTAGLAALVGAPAGRAAPRCAAVLDVGTNSVKFHLARRGPGGAWTTLADRAEVTRLGEGLGANGEIQPAAAARTLDAIGSMAAQARAAGAERIVAVGTMGLRSARNAAAFLEECRRRHGLEIEVLSGEEEGRLAHLAVVAGLGAPPGRIVVFDTGGGSSQFTFGRGRDVEERFSLDVGAVRLTEEFGLAGAVPAARVREALAALAAALGRLDGRPAPDVLVGMGGAVTNLVAVALGLAPYDPERVQGARLSRAEVDRQIEVYRTLDAPARRALVGLQPARAEVILAGALVVRTVLDKLGQAELRASDRGLRHGVLAERFG